MSETLSPPGAFAPPLFRPQLMIGAVTPLWGYFAGAAMTGVAMWWVSRWMPAAKQAALVEAALAPVSEPLAELVPAPMAAEPPPAPVAEEAVVVALEMAPAVVEAAPAVAEAADAALEATPVALDPAPAAEPEVAVKLLAAPAAPRARKAKDPDAKPH
jgi:hypothetical protein